MLLSRNDYKNKGTACWLVFLQMGSWAICQPWGSPLPYSTAFLYHYPKHNCSNLFYSHILVCMYFSWEKQTNKQKNKQKENQHVDMGNNPLTFKFLVTSFGIAVSLYTSFSEIGLYTFNVFLTLLLFVFFPFVIFFCLFKCFLNIVHHWKLFTIWWSLFLH